MITTRADGAADGHYAKKQMRCKSALIAWSHRSRFAFARQLIAARTGGRLLDYGCGDGTFLSWVHASFDAVGADVDQQQIDDCTQRLSSQTGASFMLTKDLRHDDFTAAFHVVVCMEVLEHCTADNRQAVLADLRRLAAPDAEVIISVPIEIGPSLVVKQLARTLAGWRRLGDYSYRERYRMGELWKMMFAGATTSIHRPVYEADPASPVGPYHGHKGFNWRALRAELNEQFHIESLQFTPISRLGSSLNSQVWFICRPR